MLVHRRHSVLCFAGTPRFERQDTLAEILSVGPEAVASHDTAAHEWGLIKHAPRSIHIVVRRWRREHRTSCVVHESLDLEDHDRIVIDGLPLTHPARTVVDLGATSPWLVEGALSEGLRRGVFTFGEVAAFVKRVQRRGRRGVGVIRPFLAVHLESDGRTQSVLEDRFLRVLHERAVRLPIPQYEVFDPRGTFVCRADFAYPDRALLIELDGRAYHSDGRDFQLDREKQNRTQALGWRTLRFTWSDVTHRPDQAISTLRSVLA